MIKLADLKKYAGRVGIKYRPSFRSKKMIELISKEIEVSVQDLEKIIKHANNQEQFKKEIKDLLDLLKAHQNEIKDNEILRLPEDDVKPALQEETHPETVEPCLPLFETAEERLLHIENISKQNYTIKGLILKAGEVTQIDSKYRMNEDIMKRINYHIELKKFRIV